MAELSLLEMSFAGAVLIAVIAVARLFLVSRIPGKTFLALWGIVLLRLLVPVSIPSALSVYSLVSRQMTDESMAGAQSGWRTNEWNQALEAANEDANRAADKTIDETASESIFMAKISAWNIIWAAGCVSCFCYFCVIYVICRRKFAESLPVKNSFTADWLSRHKIKRSIEIRQSDRTKAPLTYGLLRPVILMPKYTDWSDERQLAYILAHEYIHIRRFDIFTKTLLVIAAAVHWFNPFVWMMYILCNRDLELTCDEMVMRNVTHASKSEYACILISMEEQKSAHVPLCSNFSKSAVEGRIRAIMKMKKVTVLTGISSAVLVAGLGLVFATSAAASGQADRAVYTFGSAIQKNAAGEEGNTASSKSFSIEFDADDADHGRTQASMDMSSKTFSFSADKDGNKAYYVYKDDKFEEYKKYGLGYDEKTGSLIYKGKKVGYFKDEWAEQVYTRFIDESGETGIIVMRDDNYKITGLEEVSIPYVFDDMPETVQPAVEINSDAANDGTEMNAAEKIEETGSAVEIGLSNDAAGGTPAGRPASVPEGYQEYGISSNEQTGEWLYNGKKIAWLYDQDGRIFCNDWFENQNEKKQAAYIVVVRNSKEKIEEVKEITEKEMKDLLKLQS